MRKTSSQNWKGLTLSLLGFIFDTIVKVLELKSKGGIKLKSMSRMADFEIACETISRCLGYNEGKFIKAYDENKALGTSHILEGSSVARAIISMLEAKDTWSGTATILLSELEEEAVKLKIDIKRDKSWPKAAHILSRRLNEIKANLEELKHFYSYNPGSEDKAKNDHHLQTTVRSTRSVRYPDSHSKQTNSSNATTNASKPDHEIASDKDNQSHAQNQNMNATNATNDTLHTSYDPKPLVYRLGDSDTWGCENCRLKGDIHEMRNHVCH